MGFFDRFRSAGRTPASSNATIATSPEQEAIRLIDEGNVIEQEGRLEEAMQRYLAAIELLPTLARAHLNRGNILLKKGDTKGAIQAFDTAIQHSPEYAAAYYNKGNVLHDLKDFEASIAAYRQAVAITPDLAVAHNNLGLALKDAVRLEEALECCHLAIKIKPDFVEAHYNQGNLLKELGNPHGSIASYRQVLKLRSNHVPAYFALGNALQEVGQLEEAVVNFQEAVNFAPDFAEAHFNLGNALQALNRFNSAVGSYSTALTIKPGFFEAHCNLGNALRSLGRLEQALSSYRRALEIQPDSAITHNSIGTILLNRAGQTEKAMVSFKRAIQLNPNFAEAHYNLGLGFRDLRNFDEYIACLRRAMEIDPHFSHPQSNLVFTLNHLGTTDATTLFAEHCRFGELFESPLRSLWPKHTNTRDPSRSLRVGFVSGDLYSHAVANFVEPIVALLARSRTLSLHAYYNNLPEDEVTQRLRRSLTHWHPVFHLSDEALAQKIIDDEIDILIDLSGHTEHHRLLTFARKPAPIQASWIGYPGTTGLHAMDYYLADRYFLPPGMFNSQFTEKIAYLTAVAPFLPFENSPPVNSLPANSNGYVTFGSFQRISKLSASVIALWAQLMRALPTARLILGNAPQDGEFNPLVNWFTQEGIALERLDFHPRANMQTYLVAHHQVDICLDTFPYSGGTTTNHALWMGVPTLTLAGNTAASRHGATILSHLGLESFIASGQTEFLQKGIAWANDLSALADLRAGLRARFDLSPVRQPEVIAASLEQALRIMWQRWCADLPAESIATDPTTAESSNDDYVAE